MRRLIIPIALLWLFDVEAQQIIFTQQINNNDNLMLYDESGNLIPLTNHPRKDSSPMVSPDGQKVVFTSERVGWWKIWVMDLQKKAIVQLTANSSADYNPSWSPDGRKILYTSTRDGNQEIYMIDPDGTNPTNLTQTRIDEVMPYWSKDGYIYFSVKQGHYYQS